MGDVNFQSVFKNRLDNATGASLGQQAHTFAQEFASLGIFVSNFANESRASSDIQSVPACSLVDNNSSYSHRRNCFPIAGELSLDHEHDPLANSDAE